jgi:DNA-binding transcriptional ArsR family regulator
MVAGANLAEIAALIGEPSRANMLLALMDGRALAAHVSPQTASEHLAGLLAGHVLTVVRQGRHRYYRLASPLLAQAIESLSVFAAIEGPARHRPHSPRDEALRLARTCYDHLAGRLGVALADALTGQGHLLLGEDGGAVTDTGLHLLREFGLALPSAGRSRRVFCRPCIDWTERRPHLAGALGAAIAARCFELGWVTRLRDTRALAVSPSGREGLRRVFGLDLDGAPERCAAPHPPDLLRTRSTAARQPA